MNNRIYLDHAATTPVHPEVVAAMLPCYTEFYGNPSAIHATGKMAKELVEDARQGVANALNAQTEEIVFTSGGTESDNAALFGAAYACPARKHLLISPIEHHAVLEPAHTLQQAGWEVEYLPVDSDGRVDPQDVRNMLRPDTLLVSVMHANNEVGTVQPIAEIGALCRHNGTLFHTDAVQTFGKLPLDVRAMHIDLLSLTAHKFYGPKGIGALFIRRGVKLQRFQQGGEQERKRRGGTLNVPGIVGLGKAVQLECAAQKTEAARLTELAEQMACMLTAGEEGVHLMGARKNRLPGNVHICVEGVEGEALLLALDEAGISVSAGAACSAGTVEPSHVLLAMGVQRDLARGALRITMGRSTTAEAVEKTVNALREAIASLRTLGCAGNEKFA